MIRSAHPKFAAFAVALAVSIAGPAAADNEPQARKFIDDGINHILTILKDQKSGRPAKLDQLRAAFRSYFDHPYIARYAAGEHFRAASAKDQQAYLRAVEDYVITTYGGRLLSYAGQIDLQLKASDLFAITHGTRFGPNYVVIHSNIKRTVAKALTIDWHVRSVKGQLKVIDVTLNGVSPIQVYRSEFVSVINRRNIGLAGLTAEIEAKNEANRATSSVDRR
jgi:phospholipid transport system substrate-binding protein